MSANTSARLIVAAVVGLNAAAVGFLIGGRWLGGAAFAVGAIWNWRETA